MASPSATPPPKNSPAPAKKRQKKKKRRNSVEKSAKSEKVVEKKDCSAKNKEKEEISSANDDASKRNMVNKKKSVAGWIGLEGKVVEKFGKSIRGNERMGPSQVTHHKPHPKNFAQRALQSERPDLFTGTNATGLSHDELQLLDEHLLKKSELRPGNYFTLGKIVDMDSKLKVGSGDDVDIVQLWAYGRFGAVYLTYKETDSYQSHYFALKTSRRMYANSRIQHEIKVLEYIYGKAKKSGFPTHISPVFFHGQSGGISYLMMPMLDCSLEKIRQEIGYKIPWSDAFFIGQEALIGIKECHQHSVVHRDIKPTNLLLGIQNTKTWWLCDFGDACRIGTKQLLSPPDSLTLPFLSRDSHKATEEKIPANIRMDIESWFYMLMDLFTSLPWKLFTEESDTLKSKNSFWTSVDNYFSSNGETLPDQLHKLALVVANGKMDESIYGKLTALLKDGFHKHLEKQPWKPCWISKKRHKVVYPLPLKKSKNQKKKK